MKLPILRDDCAFQHDASWKLYELAGKENTVMEDLAKKVRRLEYSPFSIFSFPILRFSSVMLVNFYSQLPFQMKK